jgi:hypothetical protein
MVDDQNILAAIYGPMAVTDPAKKLAINPDIDFKSPLAREAFRRAGANREAVNRRLTDVFTGGETVLIRDDPNSPAIDYTKDLIPVAVFLQRKIDGGNLPEADDRNYEKALHRFAKKHGVPYPLLKSSLEHVASNFDSVIHRTAENFYFPGDEDGFSIGMLLIEKTRSGHLNEEKTNDLDQRLNDFFKSGKVHAATREIYLKDYEAKIGTMLADALDETVSSIRSGRPYAYMYNTEKHYFSIPDYGRDPNAIYDALLFKPQDLPGRKPPMNLQQLELFWALHESEHGMARQKPPYGAFAFWPGELYTQIREIDADSAVIAAMRDMGRPDMAEYWLAYRNTAGFKNEVLQNAGETPPNSHSTGVYLRLRDAGIELDLLQYNTARKELTEKVLEKLGVKKIQHDQVTTSDIMRAATAMIKDDETQKDPAKKLSAFETHELKQFVADAEAIGYSTPATPDPAPTTPALPTRVRIAAAP